jgi:4-amino-4-deoxy-L-arabinose transferase-like glycosyltransferase
VFDEPIHLQVAQQFGPGLPAISQLRDYPSATGPFFYVLFGNLGALLGYNLTLLRVAVFALALGNVFLCFRIVRRSLPAENPISALALLATAPYFAALAGVFMTEHLALFLGLAALLCYLRFRDGGRPADAVLSLLFATLAVYTRIYYAFLPMAFAAASLGALSDRGRCDQPRRRWPQALVWVLPVVAFLPMVLLWRGFAPPFFQYAYHPAFSWQNTSSVLLWSGIVFLPWVWHELKPWHLVALLAIPVVLRAPLPGLGITRSALKLLPHSLAPVVACLFGAIGLLWFIRLTPLALKSGTRVAALGTLALVAGLLVSGPQVYERYLLPGIPLMLICARPGTRPSLALAWAGLFQLPLALAHILRLTT